MYLQGFMKYISSLHKLSRKDVNSIIDYISSLDTVSRKDAGLDDISLNILEQFAWENYLSAYQIWSNLQSPRFKMAYKNVNKRTNVLFSSGLIQETKVIGGNKRRAKYFRLTEYGIYQLFLKQLNSLLLTQPRSRTDREVADASLTFLRNYSDSILFKIFLYPYFEKETLFVIGASILWDLYEYLSTCCHSIERLINDIQLGRPLLRRNVFSWNRIPGEDDEMLLSHLKQISIL